MALIHGRPIPTSFTSSSLLRPRIPKPTRLLFLRRAYNGDKPAPPPSPEPRSLAAATGATFIKIASFLIGNRRGAETTESVASDALDGISAGDGPAVEEEKRVLRDLKGVDVTSGSEEKVVTRPGFSFSAAGLLFPYHIGVAQFLLEKGYIEETTPLAGSSAGAIICAVIASGNSMEDALKVTKLLAEDCREKGTAFRLGAVLRDILNNFLPDDVHLRANGRIRVAITRVLWKPRALLVDNFDSKEDLINAVITSSFIPGYLAPRPVTVYRRQVCIDGGLTLFMPPTSASETVRVCAFPATGIGLKGIGISPDCNPENRATVGQLFNWALEPANDDILDELYELGYLDASTWAEANPLELPVID